MRQTNRCPLVSIIIPTKNSENTLSACLDSIGKQTYTNIEVIVVDSDSTDATRQIATEFGAIIVSKDCGMAAARNFGAKFARGQFLFHMDSDMRLSPVVVEECVKAVRDGYCAAVVPQIYEGNGFFGKCRSLEFASLFNDDMIKSSRFIQKAAFEHVGGYDESIDAGEDWDITQKIESYCKIGRIGHPLVHGWGRYSLTRMVRKSYSYGKTVRRYLAKHPQHAKHQWGPLRIKHISYRRLKEDPMHALGLSFVKTCEFTAGLIGMMVALFD